VGGTFLFRQVVQFYSAVYTKDEAEQIIEDFGQFLRALAGEK